MITVVLVLRRKNELSTLEFTKFHLIKVVFKLSNQARELASTHIEICGAKRFNLDDPCLYNFEVSPFIQLPPNAH